MFENCCFVRFSKQLFKASRKKIHPSLAMATSLLPWLTFPFPSQTSSRQWSSPLSEWGPRWLWGHPCMPSTSLASCTPTSTYSTPHLYSLVWVQPAFGSQTESTSQDPVQKRRSGRIWGYIGSLWSLGKKLKIWRISIIRIWRNISVFFLKIITAKWLEALLFSGSSKEWIISMLKQDTLWY